MDPSGAQPTQDLISVDVRQHQIEQDDVIIVQLADLQPVFAEISRIANEVLFAQQQFDTGGGGRVVLDEEHAHGGLREDTATFDG